MKNLMITSILLTFWIGLFSQQSEYPSLYPENTNQKSTISMSFDPVDFEEALTSWCEEMYIPGMSVCILKNGDIYWDINYGYANIAQNKPVSDSTCFLLCSISKLFVQTAIMQLYEQEEFELDDDINGNSPQTILNPNCQDSAITYFQLMTHTSSINYGFPYLDNFVVVGDPTIPLGDFMEGSLIPGVNPTYYNNGYLWGNFCPGTHWDYVNIGHCLLGYLSENIAGQELEDYIQDNIFSPLGINNASYFLSNMDTSYLAVPYDYIGGAYAPSPQPGAPFYPAAFSKMSAIDLGKFLGMYMKNGSYNGNILLEPETVDIITTPNEGSLYSTYLGQMCLTWMYLENHDMTYWGGGWKQIASSGIGYDKDDQWGMIFLTNTRLDNTQHFQLQDMIVEFAKHYEPFTIEQMSLTVSDGGQVIEPDEEFTLGFTLQNYMNFPEILENATATISTNNPFISLLSDSVCNLGTVNYLVEILIPDDQFVFEVNQNLEPGNIEFQLSLNWDEGVGYTIPIDLYAGYADLLLVRDEESENNTQDWYLQSLDSLGYSTNFYDLRIRDDITTDFINTFPAVIWFTGSDSVNTVSENNQTILSTYLDNGGRLILSGQNISDELVGTDFLEEYLFVEHIEDTWTGEEKIEGIENDPIGNGFSFQVNQGDGLANQYSMSVVEPLGNGYKVFGYYPTLDGAVIRYDNDTYKSVFFAFGFEAIMGFENRSDILYRILCEYFDVCPDTIQTETNPLPMNSTISKLKVFPNPWSIFTTFSYSIEEKSHVKLEIYNINGHLVASLVDKVQSIGAYDVNFDGTNFNRGVYFCVLKSNEGIQTKKLIKLN